MNKDYSQDLSEIRNLMNRSSRFLSLSGTSGIMAGIYAITGAGIAKIFFFPTFPTQLDYQNTGYAHSQVLPIVIDLLLVLLLSVVTAYVLSVKEAKKNDVAIIRMEQLYPFAEEQVVKELAKYKNAEIVWCQEEPKNMGAWKFIEEYIEAAAIKAKSKNPRPKYV